MSLYRHVASREQLLDLMIDSAYSGIELPARPSGAWRHDLALLAHAQRRMMRAHPWAALLVGSRPPVLAGFLRPLEFALAALTGAGVEITSAAGAAAALNAFITGFTLYEHAEEEARRRTGLTKDDWRARNGAAGRAHPGQRRLSRSQPVRRARARPRPGHRIRDGLAPHPRRHPGIAAELAARESTRHLSSLIACGIGDPRWIPASARSATADLAGAIGGLSDADVRAPSPLPGWTRGHVLTHLARNAEGGNPAPGMGADRCAELRIPERGGAGSGD